MLLVPGPVSTTLPLISRFLFVLRSNFLSSKQQTIWWFNLFPSTYETLEYMRPQVLWWCFKCLEWHSSAFKCFSFNKLGKMITKLIQLLYLSMNWGTTFLQHQLSVNCCIGFFFPAAGPLGKMRELVNLIRNQRRFGTKLWGRRFGKPAPLLFQSSN